MPIMQRILLIAMLLLVSACFAADTDYVTTDKIHLLLYNEATHKYDQKQNVILNDEVVPLSLRMDIDQISQVEVRDVSSDKFICSPRYHFIPLSSPSTIASFTLNPKANIKKIDLRIKLPCAAHYREFYVEVKVKASGGNYIMKKKLPIFIHIYEES